MPMVPDGRATCYRCFKPAVTCVCESIQKIANRTPIFIMQHPRERLHPFGTVRFARLGLARVHIEVCPPHQGPATSLAAQLPPNTALLYPAPGARDIATLRSDERPAGLLV
ncbi:MAG: DTW domain-containing protein, partial [Pseudomonadota bacterium]